MKQDEIEHHAYLTLDEMDRLAELFAKGAEKLTVDLRGRTSKGKNRGKVPELGITKLSHTYLDVHRNDLEIHNKKELNKIIESYNKEGVENLYIIRLLVEWRGGDMQEWHRHVIHVNETERTSGSQRLNALTIKVGKYEDVLPYQEKYGYELVKPTICETRPNISTRKRICLGTMAESTAVVG